MLCTPVVIVAFTTFPKKKGGGGGGSNTIHMVKKRKFEHVKISYVDKPEGEQLILGKKVFSFLINLLVSKRCQPIKSYCRQV